MTEYEYSLSGHQLVRIGAIEKLKLKITNKLFKWRFAIDRYGFNLQAKDKLATLLNIQSMRRQVYLQKRAIDINYLN